MTAYRQFIVPTDMQILDALGVEPEVIEEGDTVRLIRVVTGEGDEFRLSYDTPGRSVRCQWYRGSVLILDIFREGADRLQVSSQKGESNIVIHFQTDSLAGGLHIRLAPSIAISDKLLFH
ncbi:hypothetical protein Aple_015600 [Acrocarpospora pleiomorpha]|uniref:Uncharacterized protein n=1 Tax=Acrocarpospora pleiomorpha TaxID=90975 RepID=A0A5M3XAE6_9ACTN|nr:hypothetical protein [Acrocarpospora pleiomorpha]GES18665.1 hypothetical protein Aple_015600 [Acrocarpospora pleiomorpha]